MAAAEVPTHDCAPTLDDAAVLEFCRRGFLLLPAAVDASTNAAVADWLATHGSAPPDEGGALSLLL